MPRHAYKCCIAQCSSKGTVSHRFPNPRTNMETFLKWVEIIGGDLQIIDPSLVYYKKRVCSLHFVNDDISPGTNNKLKTIAFPTLHIPVPATAVLSMAPLAESSDIQNCSTCPRPNRIHFHVRKSSNLCDRVTLHCCTWPRPTGIHFPVRISSNLCDRSKQHCSTCSRSTGIHFPVRISSNLCDHSKQHCSTCSRSTGTRFLWRTVNILDTLISQPVRTPSHPKERRFHERVLGN